MCDTTKKLKITIKNKNKPIEKPQKCLSPLIKWSGGKKEEIKLFIDYIPKEFDTYLEPFIGGGSLYFHLKPHKAVISDVHRELIDFYNAIKKGYSEQIYNFMKSHNNDEDTYYQVRDNMTIDDFVSNAERFYYLRKTCFRGMMRYNSSGKFNIPFGRYKTYNFVDIINKEYENVLNNTEVLCESFEVIFEKYNNENNFMFLDPPYDSEFTNYGYCSFGKEEHIKLANLFKQTKIKCLMIIGKTDFIVDLYKDYIVADYDKKYKFRIHSNRVVGDDINNKHLIVKNY